MAEHTPGPWGLEGTEQFGFAIRGTAPGKPIADNIGTLANARLIAQAPALLEALEDLVPLAKRAMGQANNDGAEYDSDGELAEARDAIKAAEKGA